MKIVFCFTYSKSFLSNFFMDLCRKLVIAGNTVTVFSLKGKKSDEKVDSVKIQIRKKGSYLLNYYKMFKVIKAEQPDIIISNFSYVYPALLAGCLCKTSKNIAWFHTESTHTRPKFYNLFIKKQFIKLANTVLVNSYRLKVDLIQTCSISKRSIHIIPFWTDIIKTPSSNVTIPITKTFKIGCPGRLVKGKNQRIVIDALSVLKKTNVKDVELFIAGEGNQKEELEKYTRFKNVEDSTFFLGELSINKMPSFYKKMDLIILPSLNEAFGMVFIEALQLGVPVLVSNRFGALEFLDAKTDLDNVQFNPLDSDELVSKIKVYVKGDGHKAKYFQSLYSKCFSPEKTYNLFCNALEF